MRLSKPRARLSFTLLAFALAAHAAAAQDSPAQSYLGRLWAQSGSPGVSAAVMVNGQMVFSGGVGFADLESREPQTGTTVHNIGSISKTQAAVAVMQLVEKGKVRLDDEIQVYAAWFPRKPQPITVRQLMTHTSGIRHYKEGEFGPADVMMFRHYDKFEESTRYWRDDPLLFAPGTHYSYSSYAVDLLQAVVESASGQSYERYLTEHVWGPAGMTSTQLDISARIVPRRGRGYVWNSEQGRLENAANEDVSYKYAGGGVISSDEDLVRFGHALNSGVLLRPASLAEMYRPQLSPDLPVYGSEKPAGSTQGLIFGLGKDANGRTYAQHDGAVKGTGSTYFNYYADDVIVAVHVNYDSGAISTEAAAETLAALFLPHLHPPGKAPAAAQKSHEPAVVAHP